MNKKYLIFLFRICFLIAFVFVQIQCAGPTTLVRSSQEDFWLGIHVLMDNKDAAAALTSEIPALAKNGVNLVIAEINYNYEYESHPELRGNGHISKEEIKNLLQVCKENNILLVPEFQCLGHQSWAKETFPLLTTYPQFDETPGQYPNNEGIYCRSWCPLHPDLNPIIFDLMDELIDVFKASTLHVGMDEVFLIASDFCPRCKGKNPAELFAKAVNDYHNHLQKRGVEMMMWGDRLINAKETKYSEWESSTNNTYPAIDMVPNDIIICDWHYGKMNEYNSIPYFLKKGFRVLPSSWKDVSASDALVDYSLKFNSPKMLGHLCTTWQRPVTGETSQFQPLKEAAKKLNR
ncbi:MAG: family 20 glycosylhydrolase [Ignavibacteriales bacterium]|nr:family 20 glycosylhydrolase [Ignavibacteriales bacterium]